MGNARLFFLFLEDFPAPALNVFGSSLLKHFGDIGTVSLDHANGEVNSVNKVTGRAVFLKELVAISGEGSGSGF